MRIGFIFPSRDLGGAQLLFARLSNEISIRCHDVKVFYVDYHDGFSAKWLAEKLSTVVLIEFSDITRVSLPSDVVWIVPFDVQSLWRCKNIISFQSARFIFWFIHPNLLLSFFKSTRLSFLIGLRITKILNKILLNYRYKSINRLLMKSARSNGLIYMDGENTKIPFYYFPELGEFSRIIPVPIIEKHRRINVKRDSISLAWVGRLAFDKRGALCNLLNDINSINEVNNRNIVFHIVGDGSDYKIIEKLASGLNFEVVFHKTLDDSQLDRLLREKIDILFAMGTSALEGASIGVPTVLLDGILDEMHGKYRYSWIFDTQNYNLGGRTLNPRNTLRINEVINILEDQNTVDSISNRCYEYSKCHSFDDVLIQLLSAGESCTNFLKNGDFPK